jgi:hypothetical protein
MASKRLKWQNLPPTPFFDFIYGDLNKTSPEVGIKKAAETLLRVPFDSLLYV